MAAAPRQLPLQGLTFLNTRDAHSAPALSERLSALGAQVLACPTIAFAAPESWAPFDARLDDLRADDWIVFTSANAVRAALERLAALGRPPAALAAAHIAAIGRGTAQALAAAGLAAQLTPERAQQEGLLEALHGVLSAGQRVWIPRATEARPVLEDGLRAAGHAVEATPVYRTIAPPEGLGAAREALRAGGVHWLVFTSPSTCHHFFALLDDETRAAVVRRPPRVACIGAVTAEAVRAQGFAVAAQPTRQDLDGMVQAIVEVVQADAARS